mgnify:FL=1|jgi:hypothetical protein
MNLATVIEVSFWMILPLGVLGSLLHFLFDWTKHNRLVAVFAAVNESYWEHIKIAVWPVMLAQLALFLSGGHQNPSFIPAATIALYSIPISMVGLVFAYKTLTKRNILWIDITVFFMTIAIAQTLFVLVLDQLRPTLATIIVAVFFLLGLMVAFGLFTLRPPREPDPFIDPLNQKYGLSAHPDIETRSTKQP